MKSAPGATVPLAAASRLGEIQSGPTNTLLRSRFLVVARRVLLVQAFLPTFLRTMLALTLSLTVITSGSTARGKDCETYLAPQSALTPASFFRSSIVPLNSSLSTFPLMPGTLPVLLYCHIVHLLHALGVLGQLGLT